MEFLTHLKKIIHISYYVYINQHLLPMYPAIPGIELANTKALYITKKNRVNRSFSCICLYIHNALIVIYIHIYLLIHTYKTNIYVLTKHTLTHRKAIGKHVPTITHLILSKTEIFHKSNPFSISLGFKKQRQS